MDDNKIIQYIKENYTNYISLNVVAQKFGLNPNYLSGYIKKKIGMTYQEFVDGMKIDNARQRLMNEEKTVSEIAAELGFDSSSSFIRFFKKYTGETPGAYRVRKKEK